MPDFKPTLLLPDPERTLPMRAELPRREPETQARWEAERLYERVLEAHRGDPLFVLHDGPPYTNSPVHMGTALNKILKDVAIKSRAMAGFRAPYIPGFDNHGLPIEQAVAQRLASEGREPSRAELLAECRLHAERFIGVQTEQFKRLGILGMWDDPYRTMDFAYEAGVVRLFGRLVERGYLYRGLRPSLWSPTLRSALADTEIVYKDVTSRAIDVAFAVRDDPLGVLARFPGVRAVIWTTTPWTIPANQALAFGPTIRYVVVETAFAERFLVARDLLDAVAARGAWGETRIVFELEGRELDRIEFSHPIFDRPSLGVLADYVTTEEGTGIVHTAPSHGRDDFATGEKYGLRVPNTVSEDGRLTEETGEFAGTFYKDCDTVVVERLREIGALVSAESYEHSYPHAERDGNPVITRATDQWFIALDHEELRARASEAIEEIEWIPATGEARIAAMVRNRPDWCVSRQRPWGVGVPVYYGKASGRPVLDPVAIEAVAELVGREGSGAFLEIPPSHVLPPGYEWEGETEFVAEEDVLDVWFDSGSSAINVLSRPVQPEWRPDVRFPADLYLEGSDQHRGWFNSSLLLSLAATAEAPYRSVLTHGFVVDEQGRKFSKRLGNGFDPIEACEKFGADVVRLWVATVDWREDAPCSYGILEQVGGLYRDLRNTLRFLIGNVGDFDPLAFRSDVPLDRWILEESEGLAAEVADAYARYDLNAAASALLHFCRERLSKVYLDAIKDRMYCDAPDDPARRSGQGTCLALAERLTLLLAPILVHTAEEAYDLLKASLGRDPRESVHERLFPTPSDARLLEIEASPLQVAFAVALELREGINAAFEPWKGTDGVRAKKDAVATVTLGREEYDLLARFSIPELADLTGLSWLTLVSEGEPGIVLARSPYAECARSRSRRPDVREHEWRGETVLLTDRDARVVGAR